MPAAYLLMYQKKKKNWWMDKRIIRCTYSECIKYSKILIAESDDRYMVFTLQFF